MSAPLDAFLPRIENVKRCGDGYTGKCPAHEDSKASLSFREASDGKLLVKCFTGCTVDAIAAAAGMEVRDLFPMNGDGTSPKTRRPSITRASLAADKGLPADRLEAYGCKDTKGGVHITYRLTDGSDAPRQRLRTAHSAKEGSLWVKGAGVPVPYGLDRLFDAREHGFLVLVEGESDCWTLWHHGFPALGIPGADMTGKILPEHLAGIPCVYYVREPDAGGDTFAHGMKTRLTGIGYRGELREVRLPEKDANALHKKAPERFKDAFQAALDASTIVSLDKPKAVAALEEDPEELTAFLDRKFDEGQEIIGGGLLMRQSAAMIRGWKKTLKSWEAAQGVLCLALGINYHVFPVKRSFRVLIVQAEISPARYQARLMKLLGHHKGASDLHDRLKGKVFVKNGSPKIDGDSFEILKGWVEKIKPDVVVLDPIYKFLRFADENSHSSMRLVFDRLDEIKAMGCALLLVHHNRKAIAGEAESSSMGAARGAGWEEWVDSIIAIRRDRDDRNRARLSFELRNDEEPADVYVSRDSETMWGEVTGEVTDKRQKMTPLDAQDALKSLGGRCESKGQLEQEVMRRCGVSERTAGIRIDEAVEKGLIRPINAGHGKPIGYRVEAPSLSETLPYAD